MTIRQITGGTPCFKPLHALLLAAASMFLVTCTDNSTKLSHAIERAVRALEAGRADSITTVAYRPKRQPTEPYVLIFFPEHRTSLEDLEAAGISEPLARRIFTDLAYIGVGDGALLVVYQKGERLSFITHWTRFAFVEHLLVLRGSGSQNLILEKRTDRMLIQGFE